MGINLEESRYVSIKPCPDEICCFSSEMVVVNGTSSLVAILEDDGMICVSIFLVDGKTLEVQIGTKLPSCAKWSIRDSVT